MRAYKKLNENFIGQRSSQRDGSFRNDRSISFRLLQGRRDQLSQAHDSRSSRSSRAGSSRETTRLSRFHSQTPSRSSRKTIGLSSFLSQTPTQRGTRRSHQGPASYELPRANGNGKTYERVTYSTSQSIPLRDVYESETTFPSSPQIKPRGREVTCCYTCCFTCCFMRRRKPQHGEVSAEIRSTSCYGQNPSTAQIINTRNNHNGMLAPARQSIPGAKPSRLRGWRGYKTIQNSVSTKMDSEKIELSRTRGKHLQSKRREDFLLVWRLIGKWPIDLKKILLLYLPEDYLWMFWHHFSKPLYRDAYFSQYEIKTNSGQRVIDLMRKGNVFRNLTSLSLSSKFSCVGCPFNISFPVLKTICLSQVENAEPMLRMTYPTLEVIRLRNVQRPNLNIVSKINWSVNFPKLKLLENNLIDSAWYSGLCRSSGLPLMKPEEGTQGMFIIHLDTYKGSGILDISLLPEALDCKEITLVGKRVTNIEKMLNIRDKFPVLNQVRIHTASIIDEELIHKVSQAIGSCSVSGL